MFCRLKDFGANIPKIKSPYSYISKHSNFDEGTIILHDVIVNANVNIGKNCIINSKSLLEHDVIIGDHSHISTNVTVKKNDGKLKFLMPPISIDNSSKSIFSWSIILFVSSTFS